MAQITSDEFGTSKTGKPVTRFTLKNANGMIVRIITYGSSITEIIVPDKDGKMTDVTLGCDTLKEYEDGAPYFGSIMGRVANRIGDAKFTLDGVTYNLPLNDAPTSNSIHGGPTGFDKVLWTGEVMEDKLRMRYVSADGENGYPGELTADIYFSLDNNNWLHIEYEVTSTKPTPLNITSHPHLNLAGHACNHLMEHNLTVNADSYLPLNDFRVPTGEIRSVEGTVFDLRTPVCLGERMKEVNDGIGFDNCLCLNHTGELQQATRLEHPGTGRYVECWTTEPGVQLYTCHYLNKFPGKGGVIYERYAGIAMEAQHFPNSCNIPEFPNTILRPGEVYKQNTIYKFGLMGANS